MKPSIDAPTSTRILVGALLSFAVAGPRRHKSLAGPLQGYLAATGNARPGLAVPLGRAGPGSALILWAELPGRLKL